MDRDNTTKRKTNPREKANFLSLVTFFYTIKIFIKGYTKGLQMSDIYEVTPKAHSKRLGEKLERLWQNEKDLKRSPSICRILFFCFGKTFFFIGILQFATETVKTVWSPKALSKFISYFSPGQTDLTKSDAILYGCLVIGIGLTTSLIKFNFNLILAGVAVKAKAAISSLLYRKSLKLSSESLSEVTTGKIVTIIAKDIENIEQIVRSGNDVWIAIIQTGIICYLIYQKIGMSSLPGIAFFLVVFPLEVYIGTLTYRYKLKCSRKSDERLNLIREILAASKIIKMYTWEKFFEDKIHEARKAEMKKLHKLFYTNVWITVIGSLCSKTAFFLFMMTYVWMGHNVSAEIVYYILSCFNDLEHSLSHDIPFGISQFAQLFAATKRIESVMNAPELPVKKEDTLSQQGKIYFQEGNVTAYNRNILEDITMEEIGKGLYMVVGNTGCGKTSFLRTVLGECQTTGTIKVRGRISYASQEPWLFPSSIKNNILFAEEFNEKRYREILRICSLDYDLDLLPEGDTTVIGESGINLSKGQKIRINLARALYRNSDIYLLDDCLASLDGSDKIRIFVTSSNNYVHRADKVIVIASGKATISDDVKRYQISFAQGKADGTGETNENKTEKYLSVKNIYHEDKNSGVVPLKDYLKYIEHGGGLILFTLIVLVFVLAQATTSYSDKLLSRWVTLEDNLTNYRELNQTDDIEYDSLDNKRQHEMGFYGIMVITSIILILIKSFSYFCFARMASINLHKAMVRSIMNTTMQFFDSHYIGNILNRFSKDFLTVDDTLAFVLMECFTTIFTAAGGVILLTTVNYVFLLECLLFLVVACGVKQFCQPTGRNLERLHVIARGPLTGHLNSTLEGLHTIRASNAQEIVLREFDRHQNLFSSAYWMVVTNYLSLGVFLKYVCTIFITFIIFQFLFTDVGASIGDVGLAITQSFVITDIVTSGIITIADTENLMVSVERILEFTELEAEEKQGKILIGWPEMGSICFNHVYLTYKNTKMLSSIDFVVNPREKVGIVGRTGAGKSSIITSLFRFYETQGTITIDGVDIKDIAISWLRSKISVLPQDPYLFLGTVRDNLDPLKQYTDEQIWKVLKELQLDNLITDLSVKIDKGSTFSAGQKQLLCLARIILRKNKIVILDEATANVDRETEALMQEVVQKHFSECTMLIIAHKSLSIRNCSKIMVLSNGKICQFDEPNKLMQNKNCFFHCHNGFR